MRMIFVNLPVNDGSFQDLDGHVWELLHMEQQ
jgi:predicted lactoylglutathione lyase